VEKRRLPAIAATIAVAIAVLSTTSVGHAVGSAVAPFAKRAGHAENAGAVNQIEASRKPRPGRLLPLGSDGSSRRRSCPPTWPDRRARKATTGHRGPRGRPARRALAESPVRQALAESPARRATPERRGR